MKKSARVKAAEKKARQRFDKIIHVYEDMNFVEIVAMVGGDVVTMRYYDNGMVTER